MRMNKKSIEKGREVWRRESFRLSSSLKKCWFMVQKMDSGHVRPVGQHIF